MADENVLNFATASADAAVLFAGPGEVRALARSLDWSQSPLGLTQGWSPSLRMMARTIFDSPFPICLWSGEHYALVYNDAYRRILAIKHPAALGQPGSHVWAEIWDELEPLFEGVRKKGERFYAEDAPFVMARLEDGGTEKAWFNYSLSALRDEDGNIAAVLNITTETTARVLVERRLADEQAALARITEELRTLNETLEQRVSERTVELMRAEEALRQSQKMEAVGQLTGGLAHDFNNLLAGISGSLELMQSRMQQGRLNDVDRYMGAAQGAAKRAAALTHRLLAFSRRQTLDPKPTNVNRLVTGMQELIQRTVGPSIVVEAVGLASLWPVLVDPPQLENALLNLCINSRDAMPSGGRITIETANKWLDEQAAKMQNLPEGQYLSLCVTDNGIGMAPEEIARVFEPFYTTKPMGEGTGLGLSMIYGFAQQSGGQVRIYSEVGKGTTVCIYLPRHYGEIEEEANTTERRELARSGHGKTVLVVDDEPTVRMLITEILDDLGFTYLEAGDSAAGLKILQSDVRIDLLVTDVGLPGGMNGRQMADAARQNRPDLRVLFITGYAENAAVGNGQLAPGMAVMTKPFSMEAMATRIRSMIEASRDQRGTGLPKS